MTGPEHYREAEGLVSPLIVPSIPGRESREISPDTDMILLAQVHATLALAAATAMNGYSQDGSNHDDFNEWHEACSRQAVDR